MASLSRFIYTCLRPARIPRTVGRPGSQFAACFLRQIVRFGRFLHQSRPAPDLVEREGSLFDFPLPLFAHVLLCLLNASPSLLIMRPRTVYVTGVCLS